MIFSFLKLRKKTAAALSGTLIGAGSLWGLSLWQDIPLSALANQLGALLILLLGILGIAALIGFALSRFRR
ncbi:MAG: hypothetical protein P1V29_09565 [Gammaproteobacteria bacterium]|jgi:hypothetical protein|nr:hypothetical protein [Gammaproteobacteria bacterium]